MNVTVITQPPYEPVALADVYRQLRIDPDIDNGESPAVFTHPLDADFERNIISARQWVEDQTHRSLIQQTLRLSMPSFGETDYPTARALDQFAVRCIRLLRPPVISVSSVKYYDADNVLQTVSPSDYYVTDEEVPELRFVTNFSKPTTYDRPDAVRVEYVTGYAPTSGSPASQVEYAANVPATLKEAVLVGVQLLQTSVSAADAEIMERIRHSLIATYIVHVLA